VYPEGFRYLDIETGGSEILEKKENHKRVLLLGWPDADNEFGRECIEA
jgi:hypothetical protein